MTEEEPLSEDEMRELERLTDPDESVPDAKYKFDDEFQRSIVGLLLNDRWFAVQCRDLISPAYFLDERHQLFCKILFHHIDEYNILPTKTVVGQEVKDKISDRDDKVKYHYSAEMELVYKKYVPGLDSRKYYLDKIVTFAKLVGFRDIPTEKSPNTTGLKTLTPHPCSRMPTDWPPPGILMDRPPRKVETDGLWPSLVMVP